VCVCVGCVRETSEEDGCDDGIYSSVEVCVCMYVKCVYVWAVCVFI
jgi:hypothetical protein